MGWGAGREPRAVLAPEPGPSLWSHRLDTQASSRVKSFVFRPRLLLPGVIATPTGALFNRINGKELPKVLWLKNLSKGGAQGYRWKEEMARLLFMT